MVDKTKVSENNNISWPTMVDMTSMDCHRLLRQNEIEAYSKVVSVFRAQGLFTSEKKSVLSNLQRLLNISNDRHRAEVRRAVNDDELGTISECICGKRTDDRWFSEGRRITPIIQRGIPETAFLADADAVASKIASYRIRKPTASRSISVGTECALNNDKVLAVSRANMVKTLNKIKSDENAECINIDLTELLKDASNNNACEAPVVPEAAVEVTCEADAAPKPRVISPVTEEKASLITELSTDQISNMKEQSSVLSSHLGESTKHSPTLVKQIPIFQSVITGVKRPHPVPELPISICSSQDPVPLPPTNSSESDANGGAISFISASRNFLIRPSVPTTSTVPASKVSSQGNQVNKIPCSSNPVIPIPIISRSSHSSSLVSAPSLTTFVMSGSTGPTAYISQSSNNTSRVFKGYSTVITSNQQQQQNTSTLAPVSEHRKIQIAHSIVVQSPQPSALKPLQTANSSTSRNVFYLPQGPPNRLANTMVGSTNQSSVNRPLRILPVNNSLITTSTTMGNSHTNNSIHGPLITSTNVPSNYHSQNNSRAGGDPELPSPAINLVKLAAAPANASLSSTGGGSLLANSSNINISTQSQQINPSSQLVSMLDPKRPRIAFMSTASPSTRQ